ncbi:MAG: OmpH family outer membrane protein [Amoebophilaceae bacterium]|jgi:outer membrane protein|nr:OmpH family outer membrane protein [Amoebophilaceae bacterium]
MMQKKVLLALALTLSLCKLHAENKRSVTQSPPIKIGYTSVDYIFRFLPEVKTIASECASLEKQLRSKVEASLAGYYQKEKAFKQDRDAMTEAVRNQKQLELQQLRGDCERLQLEFQEKLDSKHIDLLKPVYEKVTNAIQQVAEEDGYTHILNANMGGMPVLLYVSEEHHISDRVLKKLGVYPDKAKGTKP